MLLYAQWQVWRELLMARLVQNIFRASLCSRFTIRAAKVLLHKLITHPGLQLLMWFYFHYPTDGLPYSMMCRASSYILPRNWLSACRQELQDSSPNATRFCEISRSHGGEYEAQNLLRCTTVLLIGCRPTFQRCMLPPSSLIALMIEAECTSETSVDIQLRTRQYIPEYSKLCYNIFPIRVKYRP
jgi:hypothetical protein